MQPPIITVFVTVYNIEPYLDRFFECMQEQSFTDYRLLIIDDGSADNSLAVCRKHAKTDGRIKVLTTDHIGISAARNILLSKLETPFATSLDGDDFFDKDYLKHLFDAQKKYGADLVISNVIYRKDDGTELKRFPFRAEAKFDKGAFPDILPDLLEEERLNYLYGKLYKTEYLKDIRVEPDVKQGSDTMINCQYVLKIRSIAVIEDYDYQYIRYTNNRAVTSFNGVETFRRLLRINLFIEELMQSEGIMDDKMRNAIDGRFLYSGFLAIKELGKSKQPLSKKKKTSLIIVNDNVYREAYERQKAAGHLGAYPFRVSKPGEIPELLLDWHNLDHTVQKDRRKKKLRKLCPDLLFNLYHNLKIKTGLIPPDNK